MRRYLTVLSFLFFSATSIAASVVAEEIDSIAAIVNGKAITCYQINQDKQIMIQQIKEAGQKTTLPSDVILSERALESRIAQTIQQQEAEKLGLSVSDEEVDNAMADIESKNNLPAGQLPEILKAQGIDLADYRGTLRERLLSSKVINVAVRSNLSIS
jgi:peptidyl-prolyl cis-trans isomerase SurA